MLSMLQAHGLEAGPTQRPLLAGVVAAFIADLAAVAVLLPFGSLDTLAQAAGLERASVGLAYGGLLLLGGGLYGRLFQRAANDERGGWLFGLSFGFILWMLAPVPVLQWLPDRPILIGHPAIGLLLAQLLWGLILGALFPFVHRRLHAGLGDHAGHAGWPTGPEAAIRRLLRR